MSICVDTEWRRMKSAVVQPKAEKAAANWKVMMSLEADAAAAAGKMQRARAAIGEQREFGRMDALARDDAAQRVVGVGLQHVDHAFGRFLEPDAQQVGAFFLEDARAFSTSA